MPSHIDNTDPVAAWVAWVTQNGLNLVNNIDSRHKLRVNRREGLNQCCVIGANKIDNSIAGIAYPGGPVRQARREKAPASSFAIPIELGYQPLHEESALPKAVAQTPNGNLRGKLAQLYHSESPYLLLILCWLKRLLLELLPYLCQQVLGISVHSKLSPDGFQKTIPIRNETTFELLFRPVTRQEGSSDTAKISLRRATVCKGINAVLPYQVPKETKEPP